MFMNECIFMQDEVYDGEFKNNEWHGRGKHVNAFGVSTASIMYVMLLPHIPLDYVPLVHKSSLSCLALHQPMLTL
jgi:hypothetical protein